MKKRYHRHSQSVLGAVLCLTAAIAILLSAGPVQAQQTGFLAEIRLYGGVFAPVGWAFCDGQELLIAEYRGLHAMLGTTYGGNGTTTFKLPDLRGRTAMGAGRGVTASGQSLDIRNLGETPGKEQAAINCCGHGRMMTVDTASGGNRLDSQPPSLGLNHIICIDGLDPGATTDPVAFIGEVRLTAASTLPSGWLFCQGQELVVTDYLELYSFMGNTYGGDSIWNFALPDLRSRMVMGVGTGVDDQGHRLTQRGLGVRVGTEQADFFSTQEGQLYSVGSPRPDSDGKGLDIVPPVVVLNYMICYDGVFTRRF